MHSIGTEADDRVIALCDGLDIHTAVGAVLSGAVAGDVYVDDPARPRSALVRVKHRFYLAGAADNVGFNADMGAWFGERVYPEALREGTIEGMMAAGCPIRDMRECYQFEALPKGAPIRRWRLFSIAAMGCAPSTGVRSSPGACPSTITAVAAR